MITTQVLLVDDDLMLLQALSRTIALRMSTLKVESVGSAQEALKRLQEGEYDAVVSDIKMPGMDGLELLAHVQERHPDTPVILITGHGDHQLAIQALRGGAYDYILKPIDRDDFLAALQRALHTHQLRLQIKEQQHTLERYALSLAHLVEQRTRELEIANSTKETLQRMLAHELRLPLTSLKGIVQGVDQRLQHAERTELALTELARLKHPIRQMECLVDSVEDSSLIQSQQLVLQRTPCDLISLCQEILNEDSTTFLLEAPDESLEAEVDRKRIGRVLRYLLSHMRASAPSEASMVIRVRRKDTEAILSVYAHKPGISEETFAPLFEPSSPKQQVDLLAGKAWGLNIARSLVEQHGGHIEIQNHPEGGNIFSIVLPLAHSSADVSG